MAAQKTRALCLGLLAHVDAGKTTLTEALLYRGGARRTLGRVDHGDAFLDTAELERRKGITIFSKQALLPLPGCSVTLVDTPGHVDFAAEAERVLPILDMAVLVISGSEGVQAHTLTLWSLLERYRVPVVIFVNKMDLPGADRADVLRALRQLSPACADASSLDALYEAAAGEDEALLERYLADGRLESADVRRLIAERRLFPCCFGSALRLEGIDEFLYLIREFSPACAENPEFSAQIYKISRDAAGTRLSWLKCSGGSLSVRQNLCYVNQKGEPVEEKIQQLRLYSGEKYTLAEAIFPGQTAALTGLTQTFIGQAFGAQRAAPAPRLAPIMSYRVVLPPGLDPSLVLPKLRQLEEEEPLLHPVWEGGAIHVQMMGAVQKEVFCALVRERFELDVRLDAGRICYRETIAEPVEGVGHYEPLRHYAEVHLLLEPGEPGSGLRFATRCPTDLLDANYQNLVLTHLREKTHRGVLIGAPLTDVTITLLAGRAHQKHTEGGDFRQATYRAVRQGLMRTRSTLLEPWLRFSLTLPTAQVGRAITDFRAMAGEPESPVAMGTQSLVRGLVPASELGGYAEVVAAYTHGLGQLQLAPAGYRPCHDSERVIREADYDPERDTENPPDSVFCAHGAGCTVKWSEVEQAMHIESAWKVGGAPRVLERNLRADDRELEAIVRRAMGPVKRPQLRRADAPKAEAAVPIRETKPIYLIVDGYNVLFAWEAAAEAAKTDLETARRMLMDSLSSFAGYKSWEILLVFDGYKVSGSPGETFAYHNLQVVFTGENVTADRYIESLAAKIGGSYRVYVVTSDELVQLSGLRSGVLRMSSRELLAAMDSADREMRTHYHKQ